MKELIDQIVAKVGVSPEQAQGSVATVLEFLREKLPAPLVAQLEELINGDGGEGNPLDAAKDILGGFFGGDKD